MVNQAESDDRGTDTCCVEVRPYPEQKINLPIHAMFLIVYGVHLLENLRLNSLRRRTHMKPLSSWRR